MTVIGNINVGRPGRKSKTSGDAKFVDQINLFINDTNGGVPNFGPDLTCIYLF